MAVNTTADTIIARYVRVAADPFRRCRGLIGSRLEAGEGMLLFPCSSIHTMFMQISIDALFLDRTGRVLAVHQNLKPYRWGPYTRGSFAVLELPMNAEPDRGITAGQRLIFTTITDQQGE